MGSAVGWANYVSPADLGNCIFLLYTSNIKVFCCGIMHLYTYFFKLKICGDPAGNPVSYPKVTNLYYSHNW